MNLIFNPPPGWPKPPPGWQPPAGWTPDPTWPEPPAGWKLWLSDSDEATTPTEVEDLPEPEPPADPQQNPNARIAFLEAENAELRRALAAREGERPIDLDDARVLQAAGIYRYHHPLESAAAYKERLKELEARIADSIRESRAIVKSDLFTLNNSLAQGRRMTSDLGKLMLRAYNAEADNVIRSLRAGNVDTAKRRLEASRTAIARLGALMEMRIDDAFHALRVEEIELTADWLMKKQAEREAAREERARLREEARVQRELEEERSRLDKERAHLANALESLRTQGRDDADLIARLAAVDQAIEQNWRVGPDGCADPSTR